MKTDRSGAAKGGRGAQLWAAKYAAARTPAAVAAVEYDRARAVLKDLPEADQRRGWRELATAIETVRRAFERGDPR